MRLPFDIRVLRALTRDLRLEAIRERRHVIRLHRDAKGDDRCWITDHMVHEMLSDTPELIKPSLEEGMARCREFYATRRSMVLEIIPDCMVADPKLWDYDLRHPSEEYLLDALWLLQEAIFLHREIPGARRRTIYHDRCLYAVLPEKVVADFRLPETSEFLSRSANPNTSCPNFWDSHKACAHPCNLQEWGPCQPKVIPLTPT